MGRTPCNKLVLFDGSERHRGQLMDVRVTRTAEGIARGRDAELDAALSLLRSGR